MAMVNSPRCVRHWGQQASQLLLALLCASVCRSASPLRDAVEGTRFIPPGLELTLCIAAANRALTTLGKLPGCLTIPCPGPACLAGWLPVGAVDVLLRRFVNRQGSFQGSALLRCSLGASWQPSGSTLAYPSSRMLPSTRPFMGTQMTFAMPTTSWSLCCCSSSPQAQSGSAEGDKTCPQDWRANEKRILGTFESWDQSSVYCHESQAETEFSGCQTSARDNFARLLSGRQT